MAVDNFGPTDSLIAPARLVFAVQPVDVGELPRATKALYVGSGGDLVVRAIDSDEDVTLRNVVGGSVLALRLVAVRSSGTTATDLVGFS